MEIEGQLRTLLLQGLDADAGAYQRFLKELSVHLRAFLRRRLAQRPDAVEDLVQETLLAVHNQRHTYRSDMPVTAWAHAIARYKLIDFLRRTRTSFADVSIDEADLVMAHDDNVSAESAYDVRRLMERLPKNMRCAIEAVKLDGQSIAQAADRCGISESAVKVNIHRGLKALAALIIREMRT